MNQEKWNLVMLDINIPGRSGMKVLKEIKANYPVIPVIIFSMYPKDQFAIRAMKAGASACIAKDISSRELEKSHQGNSQWRSLFHPFHCRINDQ